MHLLKQKTVKTPLALLALTSLALTGQAYAGTVNVSVDSGNQVIVTGSSDADRLLLRTFTSSGNTFLIARSGTTINFQGNSTSRLRLPDNDRVLISTLGGADRLVVRDAVAPGLRIELGGGADRLVLRGSNQIAGGSATGNNGSDFVRGSAAGFSLASFERGSGAPTTPTTPTEPTEPTTPTAPPPVDNPGNLPVISLVNGGSPFNRGAGREEFLGTQLFVAAADINGPLSINDFNATSGLTFLGNSIEQDILDLTAIDADTTQPGNQAFTIVTEFTGVPGQLIVPSGRFDTADGAVVLSMRMDQDGDGVADIRIGFANSTISTFVSGPWADNIRL